MKPIEELLAIYNAATGGTWENHDGLIYGESNSGDESAFVADVMNENVVEQTDGEKANARFIVVAHNEFPAILTELKTLTLKINILESEANERKAKMKLLSDAAYNAINSWESGDLAGSVRELSAVLGEVRK